MNAHGIVSGGEPNHGLAVRGSVVCVARVGGASCTSYVCVCVCIEYTVVCVCVCVCVCCNRMALAVAGPALRKTMA